MRTKKLQKIKVFKFIDNNSNEVSTFRIYIENTINDFINSDEVESVIDIKINTELNDLSLYTGGNYGHPSKNTNINIYYTIIYYPAINK